MPEMKMNIDMWLRPEFMIAWIMHVVDLLANKVKKEEEGERWEREEKQHGASYYGLNFQFYNLFKI